MNKEEFNLSNYVWDLLDEKTQLQTKAIPTSKVKEFIRLLKKDFDLAVIYQWSRMKDFQVKEQIDYVINKLLGSKLSGGKE